MSPRHHKIALLITLFTFVMFTFSFFLAPLYTKFCKIAGITTPLTEKDFFKKEDASRNMIVEFTTTNNENLPWEFFPEKNSVTAHPNQIMRILFHVKNTTKKNMTVQAIPSFSPVLSSRYFHKIECFCFTQQSLKAGETKEMPVVFRIDSDLPKNIHTITLAYTLFDIKRNAS